MEIGFILNKKEKSCDKHRLRNLFQNFQNSFKKKTALLNKENKNLS